MDLGNQYLKHMFLLADLGKLYNFLKITCQIVYYIEKGHKMS